jgi:hypothetical protein
MTAAVLEFGIRAASVGDRLSIYERRLSPARERLLNGRWARRVRQRAFTRDEMEAFLLWFTSQGIGMARPVEAWSRRAGQRCIELGFDELGEALLAQDRHEFGHDVLLRDDALGLAWRWNGHNSRIDVDRLFAQPPTLGARRYARLHEDVIDGPTPYCQLAIEYEIERLSAVLGPAFIATTMAACGPEIRLCLSSVEDQVWLDQGHARLDEYQLRQFLDDHPGALPALVDAGSAALDAYGRYLEDCLDLALTTAS